MGIVGVVCGRHRRMSLRMLGWIEIVSMVACCTAWALMLGQVDQQSTVMLALMLTVMARAVIVPSTATRTLWLTLLASIPLLIVSQVRFREPNMPEMSAMVVRFLYAVDKVMWIAAFTATATVASRTIYGLRAAGQRGAPRSASTRWRRRSAAAAWARCGARATAC